MNKTQMYSDYVSATRYSVDRSRPLTRGKAAGSFLSSHSTKDCRLSDRRPVGIRVKTRVGITGGMVDGSAAYREYDSPIRPVKVNSDIGGNKRNSRRANKREFENRRSNVGRLAQ